MPPGVLFTVPGIRKKIKKDTENIRAWLKELVEAGLVEKIDLPRQPATKHSPARRAKTAYRLIWRPLEGVSNVQGDNSSGS